MENRIIPRRPDHWRFHFAELPGHAAFPVADLARKIADLLPQLP